MSNSTLQKFMQFLARGAGSVLMRYFGRPHKIEKKEGAGIVTEADKFAEQFLLKNILRKYPKSTIITEETGKYYGDDDLLWVIDPLDGTSNFAHGFPWFCVSIGLYEKGKPKAGVIYHPVLKEMFYAEVGKGANLNGKPIHVSRISKIDEGIFGTGFYYSKADKLRTEMRIFENMNEYALAVRRPGSAALDLASVACGRFVCFWERGLSSWDVAAGMIIVKEAGGKISDYKGGKTSMDGSEIIASNGRLHKRMIEIINQ